MSALPIISVVGSLSKQGRSVVNTLCESKRFHVRALTGHPESPVAKSLASLGAELIKAPLEVGKKELFIQAFRGSDAVFFLTPPIIPPASHEFQLGQEIADAAVEAGVKHIVFSSLENVSEITNGKKFAPHFTDKARVEAYIRTLPVKSTFIYLALFYTNILEYYPPRQVGDTLIFPVYLPENFKAPFVDPTTATGPAVLEIISHPEKYNRAKLPVIGEILSPREMISTFSKLTNKKVIYSDAYTRKGLLENFPDFASNELFVQEILGMGEYIVENGYYQPDLDLEWSRRIDPSALTWESFLKKTNWKGEHVSFK